MQDTLTRPKILHLVNQSKFGGTQQYILDLACNQAGRGNSIVVAAGETLDPLFADAVRSIQNVTYVQLSHVSSHIDILKDIRSLFELKQLIRVVRPSVIHIHSPKLDLLTGLATRMLRVTRYLPRLESGKAGALPVTIPIIYTVHGFWLNEHVGTIKHALHYLIEWAGLRLIDACICISQCDIDDMRKTRIAPKKIFPALVSLKLNPSRLPKTTSHDEVRSHLASLLPSPIGDKRVIGFIGNLFPGKGPGVLIEAIQQLQNKNVVAVLMGEGPLHKDLALRVTGYGLHKTVFLLGHVPSASQYLPAFDLIVLPSDKEGLPIVLLEASAIGVPVVATWVGGIPEIKQSNWILIPPQNPEALAKAIQKALELPRAKPKSKEQLQKEYNDFLWKTDEVYNSVLRSSSGMTGF